MSEIAKFECAPGLRLDAHERLMEVHLRNVDQRLDRIERAMERLEKRLWITVYGVIGVILSHAIQSILAVAP